MYPGFTGSEVSSLRCRWRGWCSAFVAWYGKDTTLSVCLLFSRSVSRDRLLGEVRFTNTRAGLRWLVPLVVSGEAERYYGM